ncbi:hypothetical protein PP914_gp114 [Arthrobacter phage Qui]|jgi:hypothetical protein|uniref:Uncharacterized protein n=1 Tax=Arthrobacter phage Qui TaxID=2603260 RepID=A0A5B8WFX9_9CAUD|nr:hypothetical protein PP914_gp114 [Arthrobacter phage Qui]QED11604.1 hypothetical protein SEA_QUI_114 [Arthrobacter phage Qui]QOC56436.1 hypothetical protein SEA_PAELLA_114 [Arthrobacter phage Paella]
MTQDLKTDLMLWNLTAQSQEAKNRKVIFFDPFESNLIMEEN